MSALQGQTISDVVGVELPGAEARRYALITCAELADIQIQTLSSLELRALLLLRAHALRGEVRLSLQRIAEASRCSVRSASRALRALEAASLIHRERRILRRAQDQHAQEVIVYHLLPLERAGGER